MAGSRLRRSPRRNPTGTGGDEPAGGAQRPSPANGSGSPSPAPPPADSRVPTPTDSRVPTPAASRTPTPAPAPAPVPAKYTDADFHQFMKVFMDSQGRSRTHEGPRESSLKARFPDLYHGKSHMDCYQFCQQCEDHFETAGATGPNRVPFAASFLRGPINFRWHQHKLRHQGEGMDPVAWVEFKAFLRKNLGDSRAFVDSIWSRVKRNSQYQLEEVQDWASHLEHLQSILTEFDANGVPAESFMIRFFREGLKPSVRAQIEQRGRESDSWEELVEKAVDAEAKAVLLPTSLIRDMDQQAPRGNRPVHTTAKAQTQGLSMKDPRVEEPKSKPSESKSSASLRTEQPDSSEKARKEKKKKWQKERRDKKRDSTPATGVNTTDTAGGQKKKKKTSNRTSGDISDITCYNCNKKGHYANTCPEPPKN